jgi:hypothetical protein
MSVGPSNLVADAPFPRYDLQDLALASRGANPNGVDDEEVATPRWRRACG